MNKLGVHAFVWAKGWSNEECARAIGNSAKVGFDLIEIAALDPKTVDVDFTRRQLEKAGIGGHIYKLLSNPIYVGRIAHKGQVHEGQHKTILPQELWEQVQRGLRDHRSAARTNRTRQSSDALLMGKLYDDGGNRMSPAWARKGPKRWRCYVSQAALQGNKSKAGSIVRVPAGDVETLVAEAVGNLSPDRTASNRHSQPD